MGDWQKTDIGLIPSEWKLTTVGQLEKKGVIEKPLDGNHGGKHPKGTDFVAEGIPFVMATDINNGRIDLKNCKFITKEQADSLNKGFAIKNDVLLTHKATLGRTAIVGDIKTPYIMLTPQVTYYRILDNNRLYKKFLKYYFDSPVFQKTFVNHGDSGSTRAYIGITAQRELPVILPVEIKEQKAIASVLSSLDDKIDLLHRQNKTFEAMAETLFRQWFVEEARDDWDWVELGQFIEVMRGLSYKGSGLADINSGIPMHNLNSVHEGGGYKFEGIKYYSGDYRERHLVQPGDIIITNTEQGHDFLLIGYPAIVPSYFGNLGIFSQHIYKIGIKNDKITTPFLFYLLMSYDVREQIVGSTNGSTVNMLPKNGIEWTKFKMPPEIKINEFTDIVEPMMIKKEKNYYQIRTLEKLRDTLLPKLMSGEVRVEYEH
jgi:type I restriction enzyme, S subunit